MTHLLSKLGRLIKHRWMDESDAHRAVPPALAAQLTQHVAASEQRHTGEIRICVEASLPLGDLWQALRSAVPVSQLVRERALMMFGRLRVWDTEHNNGVLIYLLLAEQAIELVADRGAARHVDPAAWQAVVEQMQTALRENRYEEALTQALQEVSALLVQHFPRQAQDEDLRLNQLPDAPLIG